MMYQQLLQRAKKEKALVSQTLGTLIIFNSETIVNDIRTRWLFGKSVNNDIIGEYRSNDYKMFKVSKNPRAGGTVDLTLTGSLGQKLTIFKQSDLTYRIESKDYKFKKIADKYGLEQFNLDIQQTNELFDMLYLTVLEEYIDNVYLL
jgi:hypothetical protein